MAFWYGNLIIRKTIPKIKRGGDNDDLLRRSFGEGS